MSDEKISVYNLSDLKNTSDDAIPNYLNSLGFVQSHRLIDVRLGLGYSSLAVSIACLVWDWKLGFEATKYYSAVAVVLYMALNAALAYWMRNIEGSTIYVGTSPGGDTITIATSVKKYTPIYNVDITVSGTSKDVPLKISLARPFSEWFDSAGHFVATPFQTMFATAIPAVGQADPKRVAKPAAAADSAAYSTDILNALAAAQDAADGDSATAMASATGTIGKKGGKRRKA